MSENRPADKPILAGDALPHGPAVLAVVLFLVPPVAWVLSLGLSYLVDDFVCSAAWSVGAEAPATGVRLIVVVLNLVLLAVTAVAGVLAFRGRRRSGRAAHVMSFLSWTTVGSAALFGYGIVLIAASAFVLRTCSP